MKIDLLLASLMMATLLGCTTPAGPSPDKEPAPIDSEPPPSSASKTTARWEAPSDRSFWALASASANAEGAIAYAEQEAPESGGSSMKTRIKLQRLDSMGALNGSPIELGVVETDYLSGLTLASDGDQYIACWSDDSQIACAAAPVGQGSASPGYSTAGVAPSLAYSSSTWALAYRIESNAAVVRLGSDGMAAGSPVVLEGSGDSTFGSLPLFAATELGFVLVAGAEVRVTSFDFNLSPVADVDLGVNDWAFGAIAVSDTKVAIHLSEPYGSNLFLFEDGPLTALAEAQPFGGGGKLGVRAALAAEGSSFGMLMPYSDPNGPGGDELIYRVIDQGDVPASKLALDVDFSVDDDDPRALLRLKDGLFLAEISSRQEVVVARINRP